MQVGIVKKWFDGEGYGFINQPGTHEDVFVHYTQVRMEGRKFLNPGQQVRFTVERRDRGLVAVGVEVLEAAQGEELCHACGQKVPR